MIDFEDDAMWHLNQHQDKIATVLLVTIDDVIIFGTLVYDEYIEIFEKSKYIIDISENKNYTLLLFQDENENELLKMSFPTKLGAAFLSNPGFFRANTQSEPNGKGLDHKWGYVNLGYKYDGKTFIEFQEGGPMDLLEKVYL